MVNREYPEWFIKELATDEDKQKALNGSLLSSDRVKFYCVEHGVYNQKVYNHIKLHTGEKLKGCPKCAEIRRRCNFSKYKMEKRPNYPDWFIEDLYLEEDKQKAKDKILKYNEKVEFYCKEHGVYTQIIADHIDYKTQFKKQGCPICGEVKRVQSRINNSKEKRLDYPEWFIDDLAKDEDKQKAKNKEFTWSSKVEFTCSLHGSYYQRIDAHMDTKTFSKKQGCPICGNKQRVLTKKKVEDESRVYPDWFIEDLYLEEDKKRAVQGCVRTNEYLEFYCKKHGVYKQYVGNHIVLHTNNPKCNCPVCSKQLSIKEKEIFEYIKSLGICVEDRNRTLIRNPETKKPLELDIYIPDKKIAIEYNGSLWHGEKFKYNKTYHKDKFILCQQQGIRLISIFDKDWFNNNDKIKQFLKDLLLTKIRIFGRKTSVKQVSLKEARGFYDSYHLKGSDISYSISYGLFYNNVLVSCMSFSKPKFGKQKNIEWDLRRYCVKPGYFVIGGAKKLFTAFIKENKPTSIVTYSDNDYFSGDVYSKLGFSFVKYTDLPYYWAKDNHFYSRQRCQVKVLKEKYPEIYKESLSIQGNKEDYIMHKLGYYKVYRSGNKKWIWTRESK